MPFVRILFDSIQTARRHTPFFIEEEGVGIWLSTERNDLPASLRRITLTRDAIHLPSVDKHGAPLTAHLADSLLAEALAIGLLRLNLARGYWTLSHDGKLQEETVRIAFSPTPVNRNNLVKFAASILKQCNQDAVAYEIDGRVYVVSQKHG